MSRIKIIAWILFRIALYNTIGVGTVGLLRILQNVIESVSWNEELLYFPLLVLTLILANMVYVVGNLLEGLHSKLWSTKQNFKSREKQFFKIALVMIGIVNVGAIVLYFLKR